jgi:hypothetical protein
VPAGSASPFIEALDFPGNEDKKLVMGMAMPARLHWA